MIDNTLATLLDALEKQNLHREKQNIIQALANIDRASTNIQASIKTQMKASIDREDFDQLSQLQKTHQIVDNLKQDLSCYVLLADIPQPMESEQKTPNEPTIPHKPNTNNTAFNNIVKTFIETHYEITGDPTDNVKMQDMYEKYIAFRKENDPNGIGKATNYKFYDNIQSQYGLKINVVHYKTTHARFFTGIKEKTNSIIPEKASDFTVGMTVEHDTYGIGHIETIKDNAITVKFNDHKNTKRFAIDYVISHRTLIPIII